VRTPAGTECPYYYEDFARGRQRQECRLIDQTPGGGRWSPNLCAACRVPKIVLANACPHLVLEARVRRRVLGLVRSVEVSASCTRVLEPVAEPEIGCGHCHELPAPFLPGDRPR
jgi:hypothetical protein